MDDMENLVQSLTDAAQAFDHETVAHLVQKNSSLDLKGESLPIDMYLQNVFEEPDRMVGYADRRLIQSLQGAGCRVCQECLRCVVRNCDQFVSLVVDGGLDLTHLEHGFSLTDIGLADLDEPNPEALGVPFAALPFYAPPLPGSDDEASSDWDGSAERECVRRLIEAGADMWPFSEPGLSVDRPPRPGSITRDAQQLMASIVWPDAFTYVPQPSVYNGPVMLVGVDPTHIRPADRPYAEYLFGAFAQRREGRRKEANWQRRGIVLMCLLRHCLATTGGSGDGGVVAACNPAMKKSAAGTEQQHQLLTPVASLIVRLRSKDVAIRAIFAYL